jgi:Family of unknown function (DUF5681)
MSRNKSQKLQRQSHGLGDDSDEGLGAAKYKVGYKRPPVSTRFKPGCSGNSKGRPKGQRNFKTIIEEALNAPVVVREGDKKRHVKKAEAIVLRQLDSAMKGDGRATETVIKLMKLMGLLDPKQAEAEVAKLSAAEESIFAEIVGQRAPSRRRRRNGR